MSPVRHNSTMKTMEAVAAAAEEAAVDPWRAAEAVAAWVVAAAEAADRHHPILGRAVAAADPYRGVREEGTVVAEACREGVPCPEEAVSSTNK